MREIAIMSLYTKWYEIAMIWKMEAHYRLFHFIMILSCTIVAFQATAFCAQSENDISFEEIEKKEEKKRQKRTTVKSNAFVSERGKKSRKTFWAKFNM